MKTTEAGGDRPGLRAGAGKSRGRKRHWLVDTLGLLVGVLITSAAVDDGVATLLLLDQITPQDFPRLRLTRLRV